MPHSTAVLIPNFRGSTGYGQAFLDALPGFVGQRDVQDCMGACQAAAAKGGWALGGCASCWGGRAVLGGGSGGLMQDRATAWGACIGIGGPAGRVRVRACR